MPSARARRYRAGSVHLRRASRSEAASRDTARFAASHPCGSPVRSGSAQAALFRKTSEAPAAAGWGLFRPGRRPCAAAAPEAAAAAPPLLRRICCRDRKAPRATRPAPTYRAPRACARRFYQALPALRDGRRRSVRPGTWPGAAAAHSTRSCRPVRSAWRFADSGIPARQAPARTRRVPFAGRTAARRQSPAGAKKRPRPHIGLPDSRQTGP